MNKSKKIKKITMLAIFIGLVVCLQLFSNYVQFGPVSITLALIPIAVGAILYGPLVGLMLGMVCGFVVFFAPSTISLFWPIGIFKTLIVCLFKTGIAGLIAGLIYKLINNKNKTFAAVCASIVVPLINTGLFSLAAVTWFSEIIGNNNFFEYFVLTIIGVNFLLEFFINSFLSPVVVRIVNFMELNNNDDN